MGLALFAPYIPPPLVAAAAAAAIALHEADRFPVDSERWKGPNDPNELRREWGWDEEEEECDCVVAAFVFVGIGTA